jgi:hypothetical protein
MTKLLISLAVLPFLAGVALAGSGTLLTEVQMDQITGNAPRDRFASPMHHRHLTNERSRIRATSGSPPHSRQLSRSRTSRSSRSGQVSSPTPATARVKALSAELR